MILRSGCRCDICGHTTKDEKVMDTFKAFSLPRTGKFPGIASSKDPKVPATLHCCPECEPKMKRAFLVGNVSLLPSGPIKNMIDKHAFRHTIMRNVHDARRPSRFH